MMEELPTGADVARFLGRIGEPDLVKLADEHVGLVAAFVRAYTRRSGFNADGDEVAEDLRAVIVTATARLVTNPAQVEREAADSYAAVGAFNGFSPARAAVLHLYRTTDGMRNAPHRFEIP